MKEPTPKQRIARARKRVDGILEDVEVLVEYGVEARMVTHTRMLVNAEEVNSRQRRAIDEAVAVLSAVANRDQRHTWEQQTHELVAVIERVRATLRGTYTAQALPAGAAPTRALQATLR